MCLTLCEFAKCGIFKFDPSKTSIQDQKNTPKLFRDYTLSHCLISLKVCPETLHFDFSYRTLPQGYRCSRPRSLTRRLTRTSTCAPYLPTSRRTMPLIPTPPPRGGTWTERWVSLLKSTYVTMKLTQTI